MIETITYMAHTDRIEVKQVEGTRDFKEKDFVVYINNGLLFRVENKRQLKWMKESGNYIKILE